MVTVMYVGGPINGHVEQVEPTADGGPPEVRVFEPAALYVGAADEPTPTVPVRYARELSTTQGLVVQWLYVHASQPA